jgi:chromatin remodeling complex protein RSC6
LKTRKKEREDLGVDLYGIQQELARYQMMLEKKHDEFSEVTQVRTQEEQQLDDVRNMYKDLQYNVNVEKKKSKSLICAMIYSIEQFVFLLLWSLPLSLKNCSYMCH